MEDEVRYVGVMAENLPIKTLHLSDDSASRVKVTLWREFASTGDTKPGDDIKITDLIQSMYTSEISLSATCNSTVEKTEATLIRVTKILWASAYKKGLRSSCETWEVLTASAEVLQQAIPDVTDLKTIAEDGLKILMFENKGSDVISISQTHQ